MRLVRKRATSGTFVELFAGVAGLSRAVQAKGMKVASLSDFDPTYQARTSFDLLKVSDFSRLLRFIKRKKVRWLHAAPPCKTFSRARRSDEFGCVKKLRSAEHPEGLGPPHLRPWAVIEANKLTNLTARLCRAQLRAGGQFSVENPEDSLLWGMTQFARLAQLPSVRKIDGDQCVFGGPFVKATRWLTNAAWMNCLAKRCPGQPRHPRHIILKGFTTFEDGTRGWMTSRAAEYPEDLCRALAEEYAKAPETRSEVARVSSDGEGTHDPYETETRQARRERDNQEAIGGMRNPHMSCAKVPGWRRVGQRLRSCLGPVMAEFARELKTAVGAIGDPHHVGLPLALLESARAALEHEFGARTPDACGSETPVQHHLLGALVAAANDPDDAVVRWLQSGTPMGIVNDIDTVGIFPPSDGLEQARGSLEEAEDAAPWVEALGNYTSYVENATLANAELEGELAKGFLEWSASKKGKCAILSRICVAL